jgi:hypothetical protein
VKTQGLLLLLSWKVNNFQSVEPFSCSKCLGNCSKKGEVKSVKEIINA